jgi:type III pantothenate kinase
MNEPTRAWLSVDIGNTNIVLGLHDADDGAVAHSWRVATDLRRTEDEYAVLFRLLEEDDRAPEAVWIGACVCSVVPALTPVVARAVERVHGVKPLVLDGNTKLNIRNRYRNPQEVGADRLADAAGAFDRYGAPVIIVDLGTATTLEVVSSSGDYLGGCILPGLDATADALYRSTAKLPRISVEMPSNVLGRTTLESIRSGLFYGAIGGIDSLVERLWEEIGERGIVVATGGLSSVIAKHSKTITHADPHLALHGLWVIWNLNQPRAGKTAKRKRF